IDDAAHVVRRNGVEIDLTPKEYELLIALARREGAPVSQEVLRNEVWKGRISPASRTIAQHVVELRKKLELDPRKPRMLRTASKYGYSLKGRAVSGAPG
ncbi:MAG TPA: winged helix-turn-helix domain-containing protein, partial [Gemmatimonadaceae bacterium]|nr:winged helix-turn-helix domain-containing protein [Gemmatimonadaceae bacterium]